MRRRFLMAFLIGACGLAAATALAEEKKSDDKKPNIAIRDDCDPSDPAWAPTGGCTLKGGVVTFAEFGSRSSSLLCRQEAPSGIRRGAAVVRVGKEL